MIRPASERLKSLTDHPWFWWFKGADISLDDDSIDGRQEVVGRLWSLWERMERYRLRDRPNICTGRLEPHMLYDAVEHPALYAYWKLERDELDELKAMQEAA